MAAAIHLDRPPDPPDDPREPSTKLKQPGFSSNDGETVGVPQRNMGSSSHLQGESGESLEGGSVPRGSNTSSGKAEKNTKAEDPPVGSGANQSRQRSHQSGQFSYAAAAAGRKVSTDPLFPHVKLARRQYGTIEGKPSVSFSATEVKAGAQHLAFALVAKFSSGRPELAAIHHHFTASWPLRGRASVGYLGYRHALIIYTCEEDAVNALVSPSRQIGNSLFRLFRWSSEFHPRKEPTRITAWVRLPGLLPELFDRSFIEGIVSYFGNFLDIDDNTRTREVSSFARTCVEIDVTSILPSGIWIVLPDDKSYWQPFVFEGKLSFCGRCKMHGHTYDSCRKKKTSVDAPVTSSQPQQPSKPDETATKGSETETKAAPSQNMPSMHQPKVDLSWKAVNSKSNNKNKKKVVYQPKEHPTTNTQQEPRHDGVKKNQPGPLKDSHIQQPSQQQNTKKGSSQITLGERVLMDKSNANPRGVNKSLNFD